MNRLYYLNPWRRKFKLASISKNLGSNFRVFTILQSENPRSHDLDHHDYQWRSQNAEKVKHTKGQLLYQAMNLYNHVPFQNRNFS